MHFEAVRFLFIYLFFCFFSNILFIYLFFDCGFCFLCGGRNNILRSLQKFLLKNVFFVLFRYFVIKYFQW